MCGFFFLQQSKGDKGEGHTVVSVRLDAEFLSESVFHWLSFNCLTVFCVDFPPLPSSSCLFVPLPTCPHPFFFFLNLQKRKSSSLLDARMAKIYRQQRHSRDGEDSASDDDDEGSSVTKLKASFIGYFVLIATMLFWAFLTSVCLSLQLLREEKWRFMPEGGARLPGGGLVLRGEACWEEARPRGEPEEASWLPAPPLSSS